MKPAEFDASRYKVWALPHPLLIHWILNPGLLINELLLGQRVPKRTLIDRESSKPFLERTFVPCPHCGALNDGRLWANENAFGHWFGYLCPACERIIPCLWNIFSVLILIVTVPLWYVPARLIRPAWMRYEKERIRRRLAAPANKTVPQNWLVHGALLFGGIMWLIVAVLPFLLGRSDLRSVAIGLPIWLGAGVVWGAMMHFLMTRKGKPKRGAGSDNREI